MSGVQQGCSATAGRRDCSSSPPRHLLTCQYCSSWYCCCCFFLQRLGVLAVQLDKLIPAKDATPDVLARFEVCCTALDAANRLKAGQQHGCASGLPASAIKAPMSPTAPASPMFPAPSTPECTPQGSTASKPPLPRQTKGSRCSIGRVLKFDI